MAPSAIDDTIRHSAYPVTEKKSRVANGYGNGNGHSTTASFVEGFEKSQYILDRHLHKSFPVASHAEGNWIYLAGGRRIFDTTCGAAVSCLGHKNQRVLKVIRDHMETGLIYIPSTFFSTRVIEDFSRELIKGTKWEMSRVYLTGSGLSTLNLLHDFMTKPSRIRGDGGYN